MRSIHTGLVLLHLIGLSMHVRAAEAPPEKPRPAARYAIGISIEDAKKLMSKEYPTSGTGILIDEDSPRLTEEQQEKECRWIIRVTDEGLILFFNWNEKLIGIKDLTKKKNAPN